MIKQLKRLSDATLAARIAATSAELDKLFAEYENISSRLKELRGVEETLKNEEFRRLQEKCQQEGTTPWPQLLDSRTTGYVYTELQQALMQLCTRHGLSPFALRNSGHFHETSQLALMVAFNRGAENEPAAMVAAFAELQPHLKPLEKAAYILEVRTSGSDDTSRYLHIHQNGSVELEQHRFGSAAVTHTFNSLLGAFQFVQQYYGQDQSTTVYEEQG